MFDELPQMNSRIEPGADEVHPIFLVVEHVAQRPPLEQLRHCVADAILVAEVVNREDVRVRERRDRTRLALEARDAIGVAAEDRGAT